MNKTERAQVEYVFGLTGGELDDSPCVLKDADGKAWHTAYHYDGAPEYATEYTKDYDSEYFTLVRECLWGAPPEILFDENGSKFERVEIFGHSGETECPGQHEDEGDKVADAHCLQGDRCVMCGEPKGESHGYIYLGDGWAEIVYRKVPTLADFPEPTFDRFDICEAWFVLECDYNVGGMLQERPSNQRRKESCGVQLNRIQFKPSFSSQGGFASLTDNGKAIYLTAVKRLDLESK